MKATTTHLTPKARRPLTRATPTLTPRRPRQTDLATAIWLRDCVFQGWNPKGEKALLRSFGLKV